MSKVNHNALSDAMDDLDAATRKAESMVAQLRRTQCTSYQEAVAVETSLLTLHLGIVTATAVLRDAYARANA